MIQIQGVQQRRAQAVEDKLRAAEERRRSLEHKKQSTARSFNERAQRVADAVQDIRLVYHVRYGLTALCCGSKRTACNKFTVLLNNACNLRNSPVL